MKTILPRSAIPKDFPVKPLKSWQAAESRATCGHCGLSWDDGKVTSMTPTPSGRCPFEYYHEYDESQADNVNRDYATVAEATALAAQILEQEMRNTSPAIRLAHLVLKLHDADYDGVHPDDATPVEESRD